MKEEDLPPEEPSPDELQDMVNYTWSRLRSLGNQTRKPYPPQPANTHDIPSTKSALDQVIQWCRSRELLGGSTGETARAADVGVQAVLLHHQHPEWTIQRIAQEVGVHRATLYRSELFKRAWQSQKRNRGDRPRYKRAGRDGSDYYALPEDEDE